MIYSDKELSCSDCGRDFTFSSTEQEQYARLGFTNDLHRCAVCRTARKAPLGEPSRDPGPASREGPPGPMFPAVCADCGKATEVPFQPREGRPVYCSDCFNRRR